jgi:hypothetical protein
MPMKTDCLKAANTVETAGGQRRQTPRYSCVASAVAVDVRSQARITGRMSELGHCGCYAETITPFVPGTQAWIQITKEDSTGAVVHFSTRAMVLYSTPGAGMGLLFTSMPSSEFVALNGLIAELQR